MESRIDGLREDEKNMDKMKEELNKIIVAKKSLRDEVKTLRAEMEPYERRPW